MTPLTYATVCSGIECMSVACRGLPLKPPKPKSAAQVAAWLKKISNPETSPDSPRYKACGNGWATNQPRWILTRLLAADGIDPFNPQGENI